MVTVGQEPEIATECLYIYKLENPAKAFVVVRLWPHGLQHARLPSSGTIFWNLLKLIEFIESVMPSNASSCVVPFSSCLQSFPASGSFFNESALHIRWPKYWSFSFSISPSNEYSGLISFRMDWFYLLAVQGTLKSLLQHHISKTSRNPYIFLR